MTHHHPLPSCILLDSIVPHLDIKDASAASPLTDLEEVSDSASTSLFTLSPSAGPHLLSPLCLSTRAKEPFNPVAKFHSACSKEEAYTCDDWKNIEDILRNRDDQDIYKKLEKLDTFPTLHNLLPGFIHNATAATCMQVVNKLQMFPLTSIWADFGSGGLSFGIQGSIFNKQTWCLDLPSVTNIIAEHLSQTDIYDKRMVLPINYISGDCMALNPTDYHADFLKVTHLTVFIGYCQGKSTNNTLSSLLTITPLPFYCSG